MPRCGPVGPAVPGYDRHAVNKLFAHLLNSWRNEALADGKMSARSYLAALKSLRLYPLELKSGQEAILLDGIGKKMAKRLDDELTRYAREFGHELTVADVELIRARNRKGSGKQQEAARLDAGLPAAACAAVLVPATATAAAPPPQPKRSAKPAETASKAKKLKTAEAQSGGSAQATASDEEAPFSMDAFDVLLVVDSSERGGKGSKSITQALQKRRVAHQVRRLSVGDYLWVARGRQTPSRELVLDCIVERKRLDDLAGSIIGPQNRYHDQKVRLMSCGISQVVFLVENVPADKLRLPATMSRRTLEQAVANTQVQSGFYVKTTNGAEDTALYLAKMTERLRKEYASRQLFSRPSSGNCEAVSPTATSLLSFNRLQYIGAKAQPRTVAELFERQLTLFRGLTAASAQPVCERFGSFAALLRAFEDCPLGLRPLLLEPLVGKTVAATVAAYFARC